MNVCIIRIVRLPILYLRIDYFQGTDFRQEPSPDPLGHRQP